MTKFLFKITYFFIPLLSFAQITDNKRLLPYNTIQEIFNDSVKNQHGIKYPIFRVYQFDDKSGQNLIVLTESFDGVTPNKDSLHHNIKAFGFVKNPTGLVKKWEINDFKLKQEHTIESSIWFWTKYCLFQDIDKDGLIDPIIVYGTSGSNGFDDGRIKIFVLFKNQKIGIRHQNGTFDFERNTQVDKVFYALPASIQTSVKAIIEKIIEDDKAIFPYGWKDAMKQKKTYFDERN
jgi:hypothetical protein